MKFNIKYKIVRGIYHIDLKYNGKWYGGGTTGCSSYDDAYCFAEMIAISKGGTVGRFSK